MSHLLNLPFYISRLLRTSHKFNNQDGEGDEVIENISDDQDDNLEKTRASGPIPRTHVT